MKFTQHDLTKLYRNMKRGRRFNEAILEICKMVDMPWMWTSGVGLEGIEAGAATFLKREDWIWSTCRSITASLSKGLDPRTWLKNNLSRINNHHVGSNRKAFSANAHKNPSIKQKDVFPHLRSFQNQAVGIGSDEVRVIVYLFDDSSVRSSDIIGWIEESCKGEFPIVWVYMNKPGSPMFTSADIGSCISQEISSNGNRLIEISIDGRDAIAVARTVQHAVEHARSCMGPSLINAKLFRANGYPNRSIVNQYMAKGGGENSRNRDPLDELREGLLKRRVTTSQEIRALETEIAREVSQVFDWAVKNFVH